ncbi:MAG: transketolase [Candidatus Pacebacteria bacterium CG10_big_fil_rev_8_21_14_0_10_42_12]|nr:MAG: transketolase [Candidatus Pacebacteria bacterium CG10_big_fil_rev_8_21_14_0_10_42_12]
MLATHATHHLRKIAASIRKDIVLMLNKAGSGHSAGALGMTDVFTALYFVLLIHRPDEPGWFGRDYVLLSNGHINPVLYATLSEAGYFDKAELNTLRQINSRLQGHPHIGSLPGIESSSGPLGQGLSQAAGLALGLKMDVKTNRVYCLMSDAEQQEGQVWEAYMLISKYRLNNLTIFIDRNNIQIGGQTEDVMPLESLANKLSSFGLKVLEIDGHDFEEITDAVRAAQSFHEGATAIICNTIPGKGVSFIENKFEWHGKVPNEEETKLAIDELSRSLKENSDE